MADSKGWNDPPSSAKKPYIAPKIVHLGSVRDLTAGGSGSVTDNVTIFKKKMTM